MPIIRYEADLLTTSYYYNQSPDHFVPEKEKQSEKYIKKTLDYFASIAFQQYNQNEETFTKNYKLLKGFIDRKDFWEDDSTSPVKSMIDTMVQDTSLPAYVKHYSILNPPINSMLGELSSRTDNSRVKAFDDDSKSEELQVKTEFLQSYIQAKIQQKVAADLQKQGYEPSTDEYNKHLAELTNEQIQEYMTSYTSLGERWANHILSALKIGFGIREKSQDSFRDLLVTSREYFHIYTDKSKIGFNVEVTNPKNAWFLTIPDEKYTKNAYASGTIKVMELSDILERYELSLEEIDYLRNQAKGFYLEGMGVRQSNLLNTKTGDASVTYDVYDPLIAKYKMLEESQMLAEHQLDTYLGLNQTGYSTYGSKFIVVHCYWKSKKKIGKLLFLDETGQQQSILVDESYKKIPTEISIEWTWINQWWQGVKIGPHIYTDFKPLQILDYSPLIGVIHEGKNSPAKSLIDLMKPYQTLYDIALNQLFLLLKKDKGVVFVTSLRHIPKPRDGDYQDAIELWEAEAMERGIIFVDDSPENLKGAGSFAQTGRHDLSRHNEIQARYNLAVALKNECWELVGFSRERLGSIAASQTATGTQAALTRSFTQTEPIFIAHEYLLNQLYQAIIDVAQYTESQNPNSIISYITNEGENAFIQVTPTDIKLKDFQVYITNTAEDRRLFEELRGLAQPMLQNGVSPYEISILYSTNSIRQMKDIFRKLKEKQEAFQEQQVEMQQQQLKQADEAQKNMLAHQELLQREAMLNTNYQNELNRINKKEIAIIQTTGSENSSEVSPIGSDMGSNEIQKINQQSAADEKNHQTALQKISLERQKIDRAHDIELKKLQLEKDKIKISEKKIKNDLQIAKYRDKGKFKEN